MDPLSLPLAATKTDTWTASGPGCHRSMRDFTLRHQSKIKGALSGFGRMVFRGYLPLGCPGAMVGFLDRSPA